MAQVGRKPLPQELRRDEQLKLSCSSSELAELRSAAQHSEIEPAVWARETLLLVARGEAVLVELESEERSRMERIAERLRLTTAQLLRRAGQAAVRKLGTAG